MAATTAMTCALKYATINNTTSIKNYSRGKIVDCDQIARMTNTNNRRDFRSYLSLYKKVNCRNYRIHKTYIALLLTL